MALAARRCGGCLRTSPYALGTGKEATVRGVVLQTLLPAGPPAPCFSHPSCAARCI